MSSEYLLNNRAENRQFEQVNNGANPILKPVQNASEINVIEQHLQQNEMTAEQRSTILEAIHRILPAEIRILQDTTHNRWVCIHYIPNTRKSLRKVRLYHPSQGFDYLKFHENDKQVIDEWYKESKWKARQGLQFLPYSEANGHQDEFLFVLALALYVATEQTLSNLQDCLCKDTENIRQVIMKVLMNGSLPHDSEAIRLQMRSHSNHQMNSLKMVEPNQPISIEAGMDDVTSVENQQIDDATYASELLLHQDELTGEQQARIVNVMHRFLPQEIRLIRDNRLETWICIEKTTEEAAEEIHVYPPHKYFEITDDLFQKENWRRWKIAVMPCLKATRQQNEFIFALAYA